MLSKANLILFENIFAFKISYLISTKVQWLFFLVIIWIYFLNWKRTDFTFIQSALVSIPANQTNTRRLFFYQIPAIIVDSDYLWCNTSITSGIIGNYKDRMKGLLQRIFAQFNHLVKACSWNQGQMHPNLLSAEKPCLLYIQFLLNFVGNLRSCTFHGWFWKR